MIASIPKSEPALKKLVDTTMATTAATPKIQALISESVFARPVSFFFQHSALHSKMFQEYLSLS